MAMARLRTSAAPLPFPALNEEGADAGRPARARLTADAEGADPKLELVNALLVVRAPFAVDRGGDSAYGAPLEGDPTDAVGEVRARRPRRRRVFARCVVGRAAVGPLGKLRAFVAALVAAAGAAFGRLVALLARREAGRRDTRCPADEPESRGERRDCRPHHATSAVTRGEGLGQSIEAHWVHSETPSSSHLSGGGGRLPSSKSPTSAVMQLARRIPTVRPNVNTEPSVVARATPHADLAGC